MKVFPEEESMCRELILLSSSLLEEMPVLPWKDESPSFTCRTQVVTILSCSFCHESESKAKASLEVFSLHSSWGCHSVEVSSVLINSVKIFNLSLSKSSATGMTFSTSRTENVFTTSSSIVVDVLHDCLSTATSVTVVSCREKKRVNNYDVLLLRRQWRLWVHLPSFDSLVFLSFFSCFRVLRSSFLQSLRIFIHSLCCHSSKDWETLDSLSTNKKVTN